MSPPLFQKIFLFLLGIIFCFPQASSADMRAPGCSSRSIDFSPRYVFIAPSYGVNIYDKKSQTWEAIPLKILEKNTILETKYTYPLPNVFLSVKVNDNEVWFGSYEKGAYKYNLITGELIRYEGYHMVYNDNTKREERIGNCELLDNVINSIVVDRRNNVWFATNCGVSKLTNGSWENFLSYPSREQKATFGGNITCMEVDHEGYLWVGRSDFSYAYYDADPPEMVVDGGISVFDGEKWIHYYAKIYNLENPDESHIKTDLISNDVQCLSIDNDEVWIGTSRGISVFNKKTKKWKSYTTENSGIVSNNITSITVGDGAIWIATDSGISKYDKINDKWINYGNDILPVSNIKSIGYDIYNKSIWAVTSLYAYVDTYVYRFDGVNWTIFPTRKRIYHKNEEELLKLGIFLKKEKVKEESEAIFSEIIQKYPDSEISVQAQYEILTMWWRKDIDALKEFQKKYPNSTYAQKIRFKIAECYFAQGDYQRAIEEYKKFIKGTQDLEEIYTAKWNITDCYKRLKDYRKEIDAWCDIYNSFYGVNELFRQRTEYIPYRIARIYMNQLEDYRKAIEWFEIYLQRQKGGSPDKVILKIGMCYENLKEYEKAIESYKRIKEGFWKFEEAKRRIIEIENRLGINREYPVKSIHLDSFNRNIVWFVSEGMIWKYDKNTKKSLNFGPKNGIPSLIEKFFVTKKYAWVKTKKGIVRIDKRTNEIRHFDYLGDIAYDGQNVWMVNFRDVKETVSIIKYNEMDDTTQEFTIDSIKLSRDYNYKIILDEKYVWIYGGQYIRGYNKENNTWDKYGQAKEYSLVFKASDEDFLWFDTDDMLGGSVGTYRFDKNTQEWKLFPKIYAERIITTKRYAWFIGIAPNFVRYDKSLDEFKTFTPAKWSWSKDFIIVGESLWVISNDGAYMLDEITGGWKEKYPAPRDFYREFRFLTIQEASIWFVYVEYSHELYRFDTVSKNWYKFTLPLSKIESIAIDKECIWIISDNKVYKYDLTTKNIEEIKLW